MNCWKRSYKTRARAWKFCLYYFTQYGFRNTPYKCKYCKLYHLTTHNNSVPSREFIEGFNKWYGSKIL